MSISGRFVVLLAVGAVPLVLLGGDPVAAWSVLTGWVLVSVAVGFVDLALAASPRRVRIERELPRRVRLGERAESALLVTNTGARTLHGTIRDAWQPSAGAEQPRSALRVDAGERSRVRQTLRPFRRGERRVSTVTIRSDGPLRLFSRQATLAAPGAIRVLPPFASRKHLPSRLARLRELDGRTAVMIRGAGTEFDSLREYVRGDDVRSIDWRATARRQDLMVRTWRPERDRRVVIVIDTARTSAARVENEPRLDTAYEAALLLAVLADRAGDRVDILLWDRRVRGRVHGARGAALLQSAVDAMAMVEPQLIEPDWAGVVPQIAELTAQRALVVLVTAVESQAQAAGLLSVVPQLTERHTVVVASVADPTIAALTESRSDSAEVYRAAAAERAMLDATRVRAALRSMGAEVATARPADLPPRLADLYLALKAAGRL